MPFPFAACGELLFTSVVNVRCSPPGAGHCLHDRSLGALVARTLGCHSLNTGTCLSRWVANPLNGPNALTTRSWRSMCLYLAFSCITSSMAELSARTGSDWLQTAKEGLSYINLIAIVFIFSVCLLYHFTMKAASRSWSRVRFSCFCFERWPAAKCFMKCLIYRDFVSSLLVFDHPLRDAISILPR